MERTLVPANVRIGLWTRTERGRERTIGAERRPPTVEHQPDLKAMVDDYEYGSSAKAKGLVPATDTESAQQIHLLRLNPTGAEALMHMDGLAS